MARGFETWSAHVFRRELNLAVMQFKRDHPGVLEAVTASRYERIKNNGSKDEGTIQDGPRMVWEAVPRANDQC